MQLTELIKKISDAINVDTVDIQHVTALLKQYKGDDYKKFVSFDDNNYSRNFITRSELFDIVLICWGSNQGTKIHGHPNKGCCVKILEGSLEETIYDTDNKEKGKIQRKEWETLYNHDTLGLHKIINNTDNPAISLHVYAPGNYQPECFNN